MQQERGTHAAAGPARKSALKQPLAAARFCGLKAALLAIACRPLRLLRVKKNRQAPAAHVFGLEPAVPSHEGTWEEGRRVFSPGGPLSDAPYGVGTARKNRRCVPGEVVSM